MIIIIPNTTNKVISCIPINCLKNIQKLNQFVKWHPYWKKELIR